MIGNYDCEFVRHFPTITAPLSTVTLCSRARFTWGDAEQRSFDELKATLKSALVLRVSRRVWDPARPMLLLSDASELAVSAILEQQDDAGAFHPVAYELRNPTPPEWLYQPHLFELLALVHALKTLRPY